MLQCPWLTSAYQHLLSPIQQGRLPHAWAIGYVPGSGEDELIAQFIGTLFCSEHPTNPCGACHSCMLYRANTHPDFYRLEVETDRTVIRIDQIRHIINKIYEHAQQGGVKVIWIKKAASLSDAAGNALLKTIEEPPANTYFILSDEQPKRLMPTLRSRCSGFYLYPPSLEDGVAWLQKRCPGYMENEWATALLLHQRAPFAAERLLRPEHWQIRKAFCQAINETVIQGHFWPLLTRFNQSNVFSQIHWFCSLLLDALKAKERAGKYITNRDQVPLVRMLARYDTDILQRWYAHWQTAAQHLRHIPGLNESLILANMLAQSEMNMM